MNFFREVGADGGVGAVFDIFSGIGGVGFDEGGQFGEGGVGGPGIIDEFYRLAVATALDFPVFCIQKIRRFTGGEGKQEYQEDDGYLNYGVQYFYLPHNLCIYVVIPALFRHSRPVSSMG
jgi:hypothetical protein